MTSLFDFSFFDFSFLGFSFLDLDLPALLSCYEGLLLLLSLSSMIPASSSASPSPPNSPPPLRAQFYSLMSSSQNRLPPSATARRAMKQLRQTLPAQSADLVVVGGETSPGKVAYMTVNPDELCDRYQAQWNENIWQVPVDAYQLRFFFFVAIQRDSTGMVKNPFHHISGAVQHLQGLSSHFGTTAEYGVDYVVLRSEPLDMYLVILQHGRCASPEAVRKFLMPYVNRETGLSPFDQYKMVLSQEYYSYKTRFPMLGGNGVILENFGPDREITFASCFLTAFTADQPVIPVHAVTVDRERVEDEEEEEEGQQRGEGLDDIVLRLCRTRDPLLQIIRRTREGGIYVYELRRHGDHSFVCPGMVQHTQGYLEGRYDAGGKLRIRCCLTEVQCPELEMGVTDKADQIVRFVRYLKLLANHNLDRADLPITLEEFGKYRISPQEFFERYFPHADYARDFAFAPLPDNPKEDVLGLSVDLMRQLMEEDMKLAVIYFNLVVNIIPNDRLYLRGGRIDRFKWLNSAIFSPIFFFKTVGKREVKTLFTTYWLEAREHRVFTCMERGPLDGNFNPKVLNSTPLPAYDLNLARSILHDPFPRLDFVLCRHVWKTICKFVVEAEDEDQRDYLSELFELWVCSVLFKFNEPTKVMLVLNSEEGGTGKSSIAALLQTLLDAQNCASMTLQKLTSTDFNSDFNKTLICTDEDVYAKRSQKTSANAEKLKSLITSDTVTDATKFGSNATVRRANTSFLATVNGADSILVAGVNANSFERRFFMLNMAPRDAQNAILRATRFECPVCRTNCTHQIEDSTQFWYLFNSRFLHPEFLPAMTAVLFERFQVLQEKHPYSMHLLLQGTASKLLVHQQAMHLNEVSRWYNDRVRDRMMFDFHDPFIGRMTLLLTHHDDPEEIRKSPDRWIRIMPIAFLHTLYNRTEGVKKLTQDEFEAQLLRHLKKLKPHHAGPTDVPCHFYQLRTVGFDHNATTQWVRLDGVTSKRCVVVPMTLLVGGKGPSGQAQGDSIRQSISNFALDQLSPRLTRDASIAYSQSPDDDDDSLPVPSGMDLLAGDNARDAEDDNVEEGDDEPDDAESIPFQESVSVEEEPNSDDDAFIDDEEEDSVPTSKKRLRPPTRTKARLPKKRVYDLDSSDDVEGDLAAFLAGQEDKGKEEADE